MTNKRATLADRQGFATILAVIIALLVVGGVVYVVQTRKVNVPASTSKSASVSARVDIPADTHFSFKRASATIIPNIDFTSGKFWQGVGNGVIHIGDNVFLRVPAGIISVNEKTKKAAYYPGPGLGSVVGWSDDGNGNVFFEVRDGLDPGLWRFDSVNGFKPVHTVNHNPPEADGVPFVDKTTGTVWVGNMGKLYAYDKNDAFTDWGAVVRERYNLPQNTWFLFLAGNSKRIFVGFWGDWYLGAKGGILEYTKTTGEWRLIQEELNVLACHGAPDCGFSISNSENFGADENYLWVLFDFHMPVSPPSVSHTHLGRMDLKKNTWEEIAIDSVPNNFSISTKPLWLAFKDRAVFFSPGNRDMGPNASSASSDIVFELIDRAVVPIFSIPQGQVFAGFEGGKIYAIDDTHLFIYNVSDKALIDSIKLPESVLEKGATIIALDDEKTALLKQFSFGEGKTNLKFYFFDLDTFAMKDLGSPLFSGYSPSEASGTFFENIVFISTYDAGGEIGSPKNRGAYRYNVAQKKFIEIGIPPTLSGNLPASFPLFSWINDEDTLYFTDGTEWFRWASSNLTLEAIPPPANAAALLNISGIDESNSSLKQNAVRSLLGGFSSASLTEIGNQLARMAHKKNFSSGTSEEILYNNRKAIFTFMGTLMIIDFNR